ncbi:uncharacterized protein LOC127832656 [Dreissena polymorpha]|nr:uncharacterized protein LOC127832656 [Dreissena polymorpha]
MKDEDRSAKLKINDEDFDTDKAACMDTTCVIELVNANASDEKFEDIRAHSSNKLDIALMMLSHLAHLLSAAFQEAGPTPWSWHAKVDYDAIHASLESLATNLRACLADLVTFPHPPSLLPLCLPVLQARGVPVGFVAYQTSGSGNCCLYQAISIHLCGDESMQHRLRLSSALYTLKNMSFYIQKYEEYFSKLSETEAVGARVQQVFSCYGVELHEHLRTSCQSWRDQLRVMMFKVVMETCEANMDSSQLHVALLSNAISCKIVQHFEDGHNPDPCRDLKLRAIAMNREPSKEFHILWCRFSSDSHNMNHIVPLTGSSQLPGWSQGFNMDNVKRENTQA